MTTNTMPKAEQIAFVPAGSITAVDVQRALEEIDGKASGAVGKYSPITVTAPSYQAVSFNVVNANATSNNVVVLNPNSVEAGDLIVIRKTDSSSNQVIFSAPVNGAGSFILTQQNQSVEFVYNGTEWYEVVKPIAGRIPIADAGNYFTGTTVEEALTQLAQFGARSYSQEAYTASAGQFTFNLVNSYTPGTNALQVFRNGLRLLVGTDYQESSTTQVSLLFAAEAGDFFIFNVGFVVNNGLVPNLSYLTEIATLTAGQTTVNLGTPYSVGVNNISVYLNGIRLVLGADYVETDSDTITLLEPAPAGAKFFAQIGQFVNDGIGIHSGQIQHTPSVLDLPVTNVHDALDALAIVDENLKANLTYYEPTYASAQALAATLPNGSNIFVFVDETRDGERVHYVVDDGLLASPTSSTAATTVTTDGRSVQEYLDSLDGDVTTLQGSSVYFVATKAAGTTLAASLPNGANVIVESDSSRFNEKVRYTVSAGALGSPVPLTATQVLATGNVSVQARIDNLDTRVTTAQNEVDAVEIRATNLETRATNVENRATALEGKAVYFAATKAAGNTLASTLPNGAQVFVEADESRFGERVRYTVTGGALGTPIALTATNVLATGNVSVQTEINRLKVSVSAKTASFTPAVADNANYYRYNSASAGVATIPTNAAQAFPLYTSLAFRQVGAGKLTITPAGGVTINGVTGTVNATRAMGSTLSLVKVGTDEWDITGDLEQV